MNRVVALATTAVLVLATGASRPDPATGNEGFRATVLLERRPIGAPPRIRFEWTNRTGAIEYLLDGSWTAPSSWAVQSRAFRVTPRNATSWDQRQVTFEVSLPSGSHSWKLRPVRLPNGPGVGEAAQLGFDLP